MEQIVSREGKLFYGRYECSNSDDAYRMFRDDFHVSIGRMAYRRLDAAERTERLHGFHVYYSNTLQKTLDKEFGKPVKRIPYRFMGMANISYCRGISGKDTPNLEEEAYWRWFDWLLMHSDEAMTRVGRKDASGRTNKNRRRYR